MDTRASPACAPRRRVQRERSSRREDSVAAVPRTAAVVQHSERPRRIFVSPGRLPCREKGLRWVASAGAEASTASQGAETRASGGLDGSGAGRFVYSGGLGAVPRIGVQAPGVRTPQRAVSGGRPRWSPQSPKRRGDSRRPAAVRSAERAAVAGGPCGRDTLHGGPRGGARRLAEGSPCGSSQLHAGGLSADVQQGAAPVAVEREHAASHRSPPAAARSSCASRRGASPPDGASAAAAWNLAAAAATVGRYPGVLRSEVLRFATLFLDLVPTKTYWSSLQLGCLPEAMGLVTALGAVFERHTPEDVAALEAAAAAAAAAPAADLGKQDAGAARRRLIPSTHAHHYHQHGSGTAFLELKNPPKDPLWQGPVAAYAVEQEAAVAAAAHWSLGFRDGGADPRREGSKYRGTSQGPMAWQPLVSSGGFYCARCARKKWRYTSEGPRTLSSAAAAPWAAGCQLGA
ncbi:Holliday junction resolvase MOC1, chloroplastic [Cyclospora cayetanensis]|uniref:Holliday junction resolvase MOC1, chloroplastic n=1 Tax=Cyclospora cayetanensis TaxID=88456 RepID=A0A6P6S0X4_9EIME|nr:Holliday junction resolvase MOC1, chloroplastic [Cyclospora cayetanensis]